MARVRGADILVKALKNEGVEVVFDLPGDPIGSISTGLRREGIRTLSFRHEQATAMAAQAYGYALRTIGVAVVPSGPAMTNAITGLLTASANCWPMLLIGGSIESRRRFRGDFQETPQVEAAAPFCKWSVAVEDPRRIPYFVNMAIRKAMNGRPGPVYLDLPSDIIAGSVEEDEVRYFPPVPPPARPLADPQDVRRAVQLLVQAERPLFLIGKGIAWSDGAEEMRQLVDRLQVPFVPSPMGKGVVPDDHPLNFAGARSFALSNADLVVLAGARFNWIFHFGEPPRFAPNVKVVQIDIDPSEIGNGVPAEVGLVGDAKMVLQQLLDEVGEKAPPRWESPWLEALRAERRKNEEAIASMVYSEEAPMNLYRMYRTIREVLDRDATVTVDGENAMAISRVMLPTYLPRHRLDAGTSACMGVAVPYAIGAQVARPGKQVVSINGDYAFGWNGMEIETAMRYDLPIVFIIANNVSVGGPQKMELGQRWEGDEQPEGIRYDKMMEAFGGHGEHVETPEQLRPALERAFAAGKPALVNVVIDRRTRRKPQPFEWMTGRRERMQY